MSDNKGLPTIAVIAAALTLVLGTYLIPSGAFATVLPSSLPPADSGAANNGNVSPTSGIEEEPPMSSENANDAGSQAVQQPTAENANDEGTGGISATNDGSNDKQASDGGSKDGNGNDDGSKDDGSGDKATSNDEESNDESGDSASTDDESSESTDSGVPSAYLDEYSTCVSDLSADDSILSQDDVVDCYGQVFGPNPTHDLGPLEQNVPASTSSMPGFENMPSAMQQPQNGQPQQQEAYPGTDNQQQMQPLGQTQPQDQQQMQPLGQTQPQDQQQIQPLGQIQPQDGQGKLQSYSDHQQMQPLGQTHTQPQNQQQMSPSQLPIDSGILDVNSIRDLVESRLGLGQ